MTDVTTAELFAAMRADPDITRAGGRTRWTYWQLPGRGPDREGFRPAAVLTTTWVRGDGYTARVSLTRIQYVPGVVFSEPFDGLEAALPTRVVTEPAARFDPHRYAAFTAAARTLAADLHNPHPRASC
jgi:hypothetical protein